MVEDVDEIVPERDSENNPDQELPPTMPKQVMGLRFRDFRELVTSHRLRLEGTNRGGAGVAVLETEFRHLKAAYDSGGPLTDTIDSFDEDKADFDVAWNHLSETYSNLHDFFGGLATLFPGTPTVEADFSDVKMTSEKHSTNLTDFSLESKLHAKQFLHFQETKTGVVNYSSLVSPYLSTFQPPRKLRTF